MVCTANGSSVFFPTTSGFLGGEVGPEMLEEMRETNRVLMEVRDLLKQQVGEKRDLVPYMLHKRDLWILCWVLEFGGLLLALREMSNTIIVLQTRIRRWSHNQICNSEIKWIHLNTKFCCLELCLLKNSAHGEWTKKKKTCTHSGYIFNWKNKSFFPWFCGLMKSVESPNLEDGRDLSAIY